jgi:hypothetical protein
MHIDMGEPLKSSDESAKSKKVSGSYLEVNKGRREGWAEERRSVRMWRCEKAQCVVRC